MLLHLSSFMTLLTLACSGCCLFTWMREDYRFARPFGTSEAESLMNVSAMGTLQCNCDPTDPLEPVNDRRRSCRACGCALVTSDPMRLYQEISRDGIQEITWNLRKAGINAARKTAADEQLHPEASLVGVGAQMR